MIPSPADDRPATNAAGPGAARAGRRDGRRTRRWTRLLAGIAAIVALAAIPMDAIASDDHGHGAPVAVPIQLAPRGQARADGIEAVAVAAPGRRLVVYLDQAGTSEPLEGATVEADADGVVMPMRDTGDGIYLADDWLPTPGLNQVTVSWRLGAAAGKLEIAMNVPQTGVRANTRAASSTSRLEQAGLGAAAAMALVTYLLATALFVWRARHRRASASG